jgi:outer membrane lipoprotein-sorting protein
MSAFLRRSSTRRLLVAVLAVVVLVGGGAAIAVAATQNTATPPPQALAPALRTALAGSRDIRGVSARVTFTDNLVTGSSMAGMTDPLLTGASGRLWISNDGRARLELQASTGDVEIVLDGTRLSVSDPSSNTVYELKLPQRSHTTQGSGADQSGSLPSLASIQNVLDRLGAHVDISAPDPSNVGGREAYTVSVSPQRDGGLLRAVQLAFDAANGTPLRIGVYAAGGSSPVLDLQLSDVSYGTVGAGAFALSRPPGARIVNLGSLGAGTGASSQAPAPVTGAAAVQQQLSFTLSAPATLADMPQREVRLVSLGSKKGALVTYGSGLGTVAVLEAPAGNGGGLSAGRGSGGSLPTVALGGGVSAVELETPLGTLLTFDRAGVSYAVAGSVPAATAEAAAKGL